MMYVRALELINWKFAPFNQSLSFSSTLQTLVTILLPSVTVSLTFFSGGGSEGQ